jgi:uncharacterized protein DUF4129
MKNHWWILGLCCLVIAVIVLLAASLHDVTFEPAQRFATAPSSPTQFRLPPLEIPSDTPVWKILLLWLAFVVNMVLFFLLLPPEVRKRILRQMISFALGTLMLLLALRYRAIRLPGTQEERMGMAGNATPGIVDALPVPTFQAPRVTPWLAFAVGLVILWALLFAGWILYRWWRRSRSDGSVALAAIAGIARNSLDELAAGRQWGDVIIEAYARMTDVVSRQRGLHRMPATTPREFADRLTGAGLPAGSVDGLTRLFESVRYGGHSSTHEDVREAQHCLESILHACGAET